MLEDEVFELAQSGEKQATEPTKENEKVEIKPYKVFGQDFSLSDPDLIDYYKTRMKMMAIKYRLVGRVNSQGQYKIPDSIRYDLVGMEKEIEENGEDYYKAIALYMKKHFYFRIKIVPIEGGKAKASLYLSEYIEDFLGLEYIVSHIADFTDVYDDNFRIKLRKAFNLVDVATKVDDTAVPDLAVVMQDCFDLELVVGGLYDMASQIFVMRLLKALEEGGEAGAKVLAKYRELLAKSKDIEINDKFRYSHYKALLDRAIDELGGYEKIGLDPKVLQAIMKDINGTVKAIDNVSNKGMIEADLPDKPKDNKNPASKGKGGGGSKKTKSDGGKKESKKSEKPKKKKEEKKTEEVKKKGDGVSASSVEKIFKESEKVANSSSNQQDNLADEQEEENEEPIVHEEPVQNQEEIIDDDDFGMSQTQSTDKKENQAIITETTIVKEVETTSLINQDTGEVLGEKIEEKVTISQATAVLEGATEEGKNVLPQTESEDFEYSL